VAVAEEVAFERAACDARVVWNDEALASARHGQGSCIVRRPSEAVVAQSA
jgi:hypothetical protein